MSFNTETIVHEIRTEFETMLHTVQRDKESTADSMERQIFNWLLALGGQLLHLYFVHRSANSERSSYRSPSGAELPYHQERRRQYYSIFGKIPLWRPYFYGAGAGGAAPLDGELSLGEDSYSDLVRELSELLSVEVAYEKVHEIFETLLGQGVSSATLQGLVLTDAEAVEGYYAQKAPPVPTTEGAILVAQADGKGVPLVREGSAPAKVRLGKGEKRTKKKEAIVTTVYTIDPAPRSPAAVSASFFHPEQRDATGEQRPPDRPHNKQLHATLDGKECALERLSHQVAQREGDHIQHRVALADGCDALQTRIQKYLPDFTLVLDFIHANEYLWKAANSLFGEQDPLRNRWVETQTLQMLSGRTTAVIEDLRALASLHKRTQTQRQTLQTAANYFERNLPFMHYDRYLELGWPIASGVIEGACRHVVKDRCELSGMRWTQDGAEALLALRTVAINAHWDDFHTYRKRQRHLRLYHTPPPATLAPEDALDDPENLPDNIIPWPTHDRNTSHKRAA